MKDFSQFLKNLMIICNKTYKSYYDFVIIKLYVIKCTNDWKCLSTVL